MHEITNRMVSFEELFGAQGARLQKRVGDAEDPIDSNKIEKPIPHPAFLADGRGPGAHLR